MSNNEEQILAWAKRSLGFASSADAITFAANGALFMDAFATEASRTYKILVEDSIHVVQWLGIRNATGTFSFANVTPWLTGVVGESGVGATMTRLSAPPKMRNGHDIVRVASIKTILHRPSTRMEWLNLQVERSLTHDDITTPVPPILRTMSYRAYLRTDHWIKTREEALDRALHRCALCNTDSNLHVHHRTYERLGAELPSDLTVLCADCHRKFHDTLPAPPSDSASPDKHHNLPEE
jgi:5-methylcytosine-specific restriction endonuclease McrA